MKEETSSQPDRAESRIPRLIARVERLETESAHLHEETAELRARIGELDDETVARRKADDDVGRLAQFIFDAAVDGGELELDQDEVRRLASRRWNGMVDVVKTELERRGQRPDELDAEMAWPVGWTERLFADPAKFPYREIRRLSEKLRIPMTRVFGLKAPDESEEVGRRPHASEGGETMTMFDDDRLDRHFQETRQMLNAAQHKFWTAFRWIVAIVAILVLAALFVAWKIWGN